MAQAPQPRPAGNRNVGGAQPVSAAPLGYQMIRNWYSGLCVDVPPSAPTTTAESSSTPATAPMRRCGPRSTSRNRGLQPESEAQLQPAVERRDQRSARLADVHQPQHPQAAHNPVRKHGGWRHAGAVHPPKLTMVPRTCMPGTGSSSDRPDVMKRGCTAGRAPLTPRGSRLWP